MLNFDWILYRATRARVRSAARRLMDEHGERAFFRAHELAWSAMGEGRRARARFWRAVCGEISHAIMRRRVVSSILAPPAANLYRFETRKRSCSVDPATRPLTIIADAKRGDLSRPPRWR